MTDELLARATAELRLSAPEAPRGIAETVMRRVRSELRPGASFSMPCDEGTARVTESVLREVITAALDRDDSIELRECTIGPSGDAPGRTSGGVPVRIGVAARWGRYTRSSPEAIRRTVVDTVAVSFGLSAHPVDVDVRDLVVGELVDELAGEGS
jgi:hypothetical protein